MNFHKPWPELGKAPDGLTSRGWEYLSYLRTCSAKSTQAQYLYGLRQFFNWCASQKLTHPDELTSEVLARYQQYLMTHVARTGHVYAPSSQVTSLHIVMKLCRWLARHEYVERNPLLDFERARLQPRRPLPVLSAKEAEWVLSQPKIETKIGLRDRTMLEVLYSTGLRRMELVRLDVGDIDMASGSVFVREGKGRRDRMAPIGARALKWVERYLEEVRDEWVKPRRHETRLFLNSNGEALRVDYLTSLTRNYVKLAGVTKPGSCHLFRRSMAAQMLANGADVRMIQKILGHTDPDTTALYTKVSFATLRAVCQRTHPGAQWPQAASDTVPNTQEGAQAKEGQS